MLRGSDTSGVSRGPSAPRSRWASHLNIALLCVLFSLIVTVVDTLSGLLVSPMVQFVPFPGRQPATQNECDPTKKKGQKTFNHSNCVSYQRQDDFFSFYYSHLYQSLFSSKLRQIMIKIAKIQTSTLDRPTLDQGFQCGVSVIPAHVQVLRRSNAVYVALQLELFLLFQRVCVM